jgi:hypothetical protein
MARQFEALLQLMNETRRAELQRLGQRYYDLKRESAPTTDVPGIAVRQQELMEQIMHQIHLQYRAIRRPLPTPEEIERMIIDYFSA